MQNPIASPAQTTTYTLTQTYFGANATYDTVTVSVIDCSSSINTINDNADMQIKLYPNPAKDQLSISYTNTENITDELLFEVYDLPGKKLITNYITANQQLTISTRELGQGIYLYRFVKNNNIVKAGKLVIIK
ncbi:MAG: T9SS type A sorting domain-containing protein [Bacteroidales bacterium]|nr:T9SS type A sorting domain-containing protein [Bacteroidales bacterium]